MSHGQAGHVAAAFLAGRDRAIGEAAGAATERGVRDRDDLGALYDAALPHNAPGAWIRRAIEDLDPGPADVADDQVDAKAVQGGMSADDVVRLLDEAGERVRQTPVTNPPSVLEHITAAQIAVGGLPADAVGVSWGTADQCTFHVQQVVAQGHIAPAARAIVLYAGMGMACTNCQQELGL